MKILITGASGNIGEYLVPSLLKHKIDFFAPTHAELDISSQSAVIDTVNAYHPNIVINLAAYTDVDGAEIHSSLAHKINADGARHLAQATAAIGSAIIQLSTDYVFDGDAAIAYKEDSPTNPKTVYGQSKLAGEAAVIAENPMHLVLRSSWLFSQNGNNFVNKILTLSQERNELSVVNDQWGAPTYAGDLAEAIVTIVRLYQKNKQLRWGIYHYCGYPYTNWFEFTQLIVTGSNEAEAAAKPNTTIIPIASTEYASPVKRPMNSRLDWTKIKCEFDIHPSDWKQALRKISLDKSELNNTRK